MRAGWTCLLLLATSACSSGSGSGATPSDDTGTDAVVQPDVADEISETTPDTTSSCTAAIATLLKPIDKVSTGAVSIVSEASGVRKVYVDASAGGFGNEDKNPRVYVDLGAATRVDITDKQGPTSTAWDLAFKRPVIFTNSGDGGSGGGGVFIVKKAFDAVTAADVTGPYSTESFVDADCNPKTDPTGAILTTMSNWYDYDAATMHLTPKPSTTFVVRGGTGTLYKVAILSYYSTPTGGTGTLGGYYLLQVGAL